MTNKTRLSQRVQKAKQLQFTNIPGVKGWYATRGSQGDAYQVHLEKHSKGNLTRKNKTVVTYHTVTCKCLKNTAYSNSKAMDICQGNSCSVCYHCIGAFIHAFTDASADNKVFCYANKETALKGMNLGGSLFKLISNDSNKALWIIVRKVKPEIKKTGKSQFENNVNILRNTREESEGID